MTASLGLLVRAAPGLLGRPLSDGERGRFEKYLNLLIKWQKTQRLIGSSDPEWIVEHLFLDSLLFLQVLPPRLEAALDLGSGAGVPGIPIKIVTPALRLVLVESQRRRASFLSTVVRELGLDGVSVIAGRVEDHLDRLERRFNAVVMRCAGDPGQLFPLAARLVVPNDGVVVATGPPAPRPLPLGEWVSVAGLAPGTSRRFAVYRSS